jgi:hypothetical protein
MGKTTLGTKFSCDFCDNNQVIVIEGNVPPEWSQVYLKAERPSSDLTEALWACPECCPIDLWQGREKRKSLAQKLWQMVTPSKETKDAT